jgi:citrate lyase subunit alpha/citrate CoA-transferase
MKTSSFVRNGAGRLVPRSVNGRKQIPFKESAGIKPRGRTAGFPIRSCAEYPADGNKVVKSLREALRRAGLRNGMTISTHHHLRNGDTLTNALFDAVDAMGVRGIRWFPSASFPCHEHLIPYFQSGVIHHCEGSMNGPLGRFASDGGMKGTGILRSHGTRYQSVQDGEVHIDVAVIAAPAADPFGNANGVEGPSACGPLGFALVDSEYADRVIVVTDHLVPFPCVPWAIQGNRVDFVVVVPSLGDPGLIVSGTTVVTRSPDRQLIAEYIARFAESAGMLKNGFSFQAGAGGTSLAFVQKLRERMKGLGIRAGFARGGSSGQLVGLLEDGLTGYILDGQAFDQAGVRSLKENPRHVPTSPFTSYNYHGKGNFASMIDLAVLGATEVDLDFNANVVTHSDGYMLHGIGGWQDCLFARCTVLALPSFRDRIPVIVRRVTTLCSPGEMIDVVVTERGIAVNPRREDLAEAVRGSGLPIRTLEDIRREVLSLCGGEPSPASVDADRPVAVVKWVDGSLLDTVYRVSSHKR